VCAAAGQVEDRQRLGSDASSSMYLKSARSYLQRGERIDCFCVLAVDVICERFVSDSRSFCKVGSEW
jgi:hypothetical protein